MSDATNDSQATTAGDQPASLPSAGDQQAASGAATAPVPDSYREALERLRAGETPQQIQAALQGKSSASEAKGDQTPPSNAASQPTGDGKAGSEDYGLDEKELNALRRAKFDLSTLKHMPPSNRKAVARSIMAAQAENDRQFQARMQELRSGKAGNKPDDPDTGTDAGAGDSDESTQSQQEAATPAGQASPQQQVNVAALPPQFDQMFAGLTMTDQDYQTLVDIGGEEFANHQRQRETRLVDGIKQVLTPLVNLSLNLATLIEEKEFEAAVSELSKQPGFENLSAEDRKALREKSELLIRAAGDPANYRYAEAVQDAAASLFRTNVNQAAQARLLQRREAALRGSPERGTGLPKQDKPMTEVERMRAIGKLLMQGKSPAEARAIVDGEA